MAKHRNKTNISKLIWLPVLVLIVASLLLAYLTIGKDVVLFNPKGIIANEQHRLLVVLTTIMVLFATPILAAIYYFAWRYRESNNKSEYSYHAGKSKRGVVLAWLAPISIFVVLASIMLPATQRLEPQDRIESDKDPLVVQVVGLRWKWLFLYPEQDIASVNHVYIPVDRPVEFLLTVDETPMSSFWIPHLGGQLYAMTEHVNRLNLMADTVGEYEGKTAEINGRGFAGMKFKVSVTSEENFEAWAEATSTQYQPLSQTMYNELLKPSEYNEIAYYSEPVNNLFASIVNKYAGPQHQHSFEGSEY